MTTKPEIRTWFKEGVRDKQQFMIVVCDTFDHEDYPVYCLAKDFDEQYKSYNGLNMQRIMEVYDLSKGMEKQLAEFRSWNMPEGFPKHNETVLENTVKIIRKAAKKKVVRKSVGKKRSTKTGRKAKRK